MTTPTLSIWTNPTTGEDRVYVNGAMHLQAGDKLWLTKHDGIGEYRANIKSNYPAGYASLGYGRNATDVAEMLAEKALAELGMDDPSWAQLIAAAK